MLLDMCMSRGADSESGTEKNGLYSSTVFLRPDDGILHDDEAWQAEDRVSLTTTVRSLIQAKPDCQQDRRRPDDQGCCKDLQVVMQAYMPYAKFLAWCD